MKKFILGNCFFLIGFLIAISLLGPLFAAPYFTMHDDVQIIRLFEMNKCFSDGQIPCRWVPDLGGLYGYPLFNYYAPLPYYFGEAFYKLLGNYLLSAKIMFAFSFLGSFLFMYLLSKRFFGKMGGSLSALFYAIAPYHAIDFYVRGAMGEMWALMFFPFIFYSIFRLFEKANIKNLLLLAVSIAGLITSHNLSAMIFMPFCLIFAAILFFQGREKKFLYLGVISVLLGFSIAAFYFIPALAEKNLAHLETTIEGYFSYTEHFKGIKKLFFERYWGYGASVREVPGLISDNMISYQIGWIHILGWLLALFSLKILWKKNKFLSSIIIFSSISILFLVFMINPRSGFLWKILDPLKYLQFPWRFLLLIIFFISFISGAFICLFKEKKWIIWVWSALLLLAVFLNWSYFKPEKFIKTNDKDYLSGENWDRQIKRSIFDYLPIFAKAPPAELATERLHMLTGESRIYDFHEGSDWISFKTQTKTHSIIRLSQYYFPEWKIFDRGEEIKVDYKDNDLGLMTIILGKGRHQIYARLYNTPVRTISNLATLLSAIIFIALLFLSFSKARKWLTYYRKGIN